MPRTGSRLTSIDSDRAPSAATSANSSRNKLHSWVSIIHGADQGALNMADKFKSRPVPHHPYLPAVVVVVLVALLTACASVPRGPAGTLADAGIKTSAAFSSDVRDLNGKLAQGEISKAFAGTWEVCQNPNPMLCEVVQEGVSVSESRLKVTKAIALRAKALSALQGAYEALKEESEYDARADLEGAVGQAVDGVNAYASFVSTLSGGASSALIAQPLAAGVKLGTGLLADQKQRKRLSSANESIAAATRRLRDALKIEADVFDSLAIAIVDERVAAQAALLQAGLVSGGDMIKPMAADLGLTLAKDADATVARSRPARVAVEAAYRAGKVAEARSLSARYRASIASLDALVVMHQDFAAERPVDMTDVLRFLAELDAAVSHSKKE